MKKLLVFLLEVLFVGTAFAQSVEIEHGNKKIVVEHHDKNGKFSQQEALKIREKVPSFVDSICGEQDCNRVQEEKIRARLYKEKIQTSKVKVTSVK